MTKPFRILAAGLLVVLCSTLAPSEDKKDGPNSAAVEKTFAALSGAIDARDAKALGELFTPTGEFVDAEDNAFRGREAIVGEFAELFKRNLAKKMTFEATEIQEISPGVLSVEAVATVAPEGADSPDIDFVAILIRQNDGRWLLACVRSLGERDEEGPHG
jgi:uncharacterized protein (TIGR02246 family)